MKQKIVTVILFSPLLLHAQNQTVHTNMLWIGYYTTIGLKNHLLMVNDIQIRTRDGTEKWSQQLIRMGASYKLNENKSLSAGLAFFRTAEYEAGDFFWKNEWRLWQEFSHSLSWGRKKFIQRWKLEERWLQQAACGRKISQYEYITRLRCRLELQVPLKKSKWMLVAGNEVMVNPEYLSSCRFFDQNRVSAAVNYKVSSSISLQAQYIKQIVWRSNISVWENADVIQFNLYHQINLQK